MKNTDLHIHSIYSDGLLTPAQVVQKAKRQNIKNLALTDHNSVDGVSEALEEGKKIGINVVPAIEIRAQEDEVLGYFIDFKNKNLKKNILKIQKNLINKLKKIISKLNEDGIKVKLSDLFQKYKPNKNLMEIHLVRYLVDKGYGSLDYWRSLIFSSGKYCISWKEIAVTDAIKLIKKYKGIPVLAHPWVDKSAKDLLIEKNFKKLIKAGLKGIEIDNGDRDERRDEKVLKQIKFLAKKYKLIITSGSDFHGDPRSKKTNLHKIGQNNCDGKVVEKLKEMIK